MARVNPREARKRRHLRVRQRVKGTPERPRLCVFRSLKHISVQVIDDSQGHTLASASSTEDSVEPTPGKVARAGLVGKAIAQRALEKGISQVVFDRGGYKYHGRVKALAEAAREAGLGF